MKLGGDAPAPPGSPSAISARCSLRHAAFPTSVLQRLSIQAVEELASNAK